MSDLTEAVAGQQNKAKDVPNPNESTAAQHNEGLFAMPKVHGTDDATRKIKNRRGKPKNATQSDKASPLSNIKQSGTKRNVKD